VADPYTRALATRARRMAAAGSAQVGGQVAAVSAVDASIDTWAWLPGSACRPAPRRLVGA
jgi:hypothetical protein